MWFHNIQYFGISTFMLHYNFFLPVTMHGHNPSLVKIASWQTGHGRGPSWSPALGMGIVNIRDGTVRKKKNRCSKYLNLFSYISDPLPFYKMKIWRLKDGYLKYSNPFPCIFDQLLSTSTNPKPPYGQVSQGANSQAHRLLLWNTYTIRRTTIMAWIKTAKINPNHCKPPDITIITIMHRKTAKDYF